MYAGSVSHEMSEEGGGVEEGVVEKSVTDVIKKGFSVLLSLSLSPVGPCRPWKGLFL